MMTYNILADQYADSDYSRDVLYPYCPSYALDISYRKHLLMKEILGYKADIICLQEVDVKIFESDFHPVFALSGYEGRHQMKLGGQVPEGTATFYRTSKYRMIETDERQLSEMIQNDPEHQKLLNKISTKEVVRDKLLGKTTTLQVTILENIQNPSQKLLVATTHLYFHPRAPHIRVIQTYLCLYLIENILNKYKQKGDGVPSVIFCGDLNSHAVGGVHQLLKTKHIPSHHSDWFIGGKADYIENMELSHNLDLTCASGTPSYTNYVTGFAGCLDYIYVDSARLRTRSVIPQPTHDEVMEHTALPNKLFPSDHLAVICDLEWT